MKRHGQQHEEPDHDDDHDDYDDVPLHRKRGFGAGLKRKKVEFVRASNPDAGQIQPTKVSSGIDVGDLYASIVFGKSNSASASSSATSLAATTGAGTGAAVNSDSSNVVSHAASPRETGNTQASTSTDDAVPICTVCSFPITTTLREHQATLAHQVSITHSHPPSALDRSRMGLRTLAAQGWDPDARVGLGLEGDGLRYPIKPVDKKDKLGLGATAPDPAAVEAAKRERESLRPKPINKKERKALALKERKRAQRLEAEIFGRGDVDRYLRGNPSGA